MSYQRFTKFSLALVLFSPFAFAGHGIRLSGLNASRPPLEHKIRVNVRLTKDRIHDSSFVYAVLGLTVQDGWHINSASPSDESMIPTSVSLSQTQGITVVATRYPKGRRLKFQFSEEPIDVYTGTIFVVLKVKVAGIQHTGKHLIPLEITYQACNDNFCLAPATLRVEVPIGVVPVSEPEAPVDKDLLPMIGQEQ